MVDILRPDFFDPFVQRDSRQDEADSAFNLPDFVQPSANRSTNGVESLNLDIAKGGTGTAEKHLAELLARTQPPD
ncbi:hypothetical protein [Mycobacteroides salmoniphilum]|uniref:hypothetical protein n=1 Tax=Mycobacteroides salmoniphilum TaxID=404941 RepID=UPI0010667F9E|nr:hypothetical protein [Mycobacteroides salmoniphilum]